MAEPLYGTTATIWPGIPPAFGYVPASPFPISRPAVPGIETYAYSSGLTPVSSAPPVGPALWGLLPGASALTGTEMAVGVTAPALLTAVAMRRGQPLGPTNDQEIEDFICDALDLLPGAAEVEVRCEGGRATLTGTVSHKRLKRDVGEIAWAIPTLHDVQNNVTIVARRRSRTSSREIETPSAAGRKQA
jgi:hypothetical protein